MDILQVYEKASGQEINVEKSTVTFSRNTPIDRRHQVHQILGMRIVDKHGKYLGLPSIVGRSKREIFAYLRDRVWQRVQGWGERALSQAGKEVLIKSVIQAIPTYAMSCFRLPDGLVKEFESIMARFWWSDKDHKKIHWLAWDDLGRSKTEGGLGFRDLRAFNKAMLAKQAWRIFTHPNCLLARIYKHRYFPNTEFSGAPTGRNPSWSWRSIQGTISLIHAGLRWRIGNGTKVRVWGDKWLPSNVYSSVFSAPVSLPRSSRVCDLMDPSAGTWNRALITANFTDEEAELILSIPLGDQHNEDQLVWAHTQSGNFSVRSAYYLARTIRQSETEAVSGSSSSRRTGQFTFLWARCVPPKVKLFAWRAYRNIIPTRSNLLKRRVLLDESCEQCGAHTENILHVLNTCHVARQVWALSNLPYSALSWPVDTVTNWFDKVYALLDSQSFDFFLVVCWVLWFNRNRVLFSDSFMSPLDIVLFARKFLQEFHRAQEHMAVQTAVGSVSHWQRPPVGCIKINFDAAICKARKAVGAGLIARDYLGNCIQWRYHVVPFMLNPMAAEAWAAKMACSLCKEFNWRSVIIEGDNSSVVQALQSLEPNSSSIGVLIADAHRLLAAVENVSYSHVRRDGNRPAHSLARQSFVLTVDSSMPPVIREDLDCDLR